MGMLAWYREADQTLIETMKSKSAEEIFEEIEALDAGETSNVYNLDKLWDGLHFLLTGVSAGRPVQNDLLSEAVVGTDMISGEESYDYIAYIDADRIAGISSALQAFDIGQALRGFSPDQFARNGVYPDIWEKEEKDSLRQELSMAFDGLKEFYAAAERGHKGVIVSIY